MFAVIFEVHPRQGHWDDYLNHAGILRPEVQAIDGFIANERFANRTEEGWLVSLSIWRDEKAVVRWRTHAQHNEFQAKGRSEILRGYHLRVAEITSDSEAPTPPPQQRFDATDVGQSKFLTLIEAPMQPGTQFESITSPGRGLTLQGWPDQQAAEASLTSQTGRRRIVRVIRDYGMRDRAEAPTYFPPVT